MQHSLNTAADISVTGVVYISDVTITDTTTPTRFTALYRAQLG